MKVVIAGGSGFLGRAITIALTGDGHEVLRLTRRPAVAGDVTWDPARDALEPRVLVGAEAIINLAGETIGTRWTAGRKRAILESRVLATGLLARVVAAMDVPPRVLLSASATGFYGNRGDEVVDERAARGTGFLADVVDAWERAADPARAAGVRVVHPRFGVVLGVGGGMLATLRPVFGAGLGGPLGNGQQWLSWVSLVDAVSAVRWLLEHADLSGAVNVVSPEPVTNAVFTRAFAQALHRPAIFAVPAVALRLAMGEMADEMLLAGQRVVPGRLTAAGFPFVHVRIVDAIAAAVGS